MEVALACGSACSYAVTGRIRTSRCPGTGDERDHAGDVRLPSGIAYSGVTSVGGPARAGTEGPREPITGKRTTGEHQITTLKCIRRRRGRRHNPDLPRSLFAWYGNRQGEAAPNCTRGFSDNILVEWRGQRQQGEALGSGRSATIHPFRQRPLTRPRRLPRGDLNVYLPDGGPAFGRPCVRTASEEE